MSQKNRNSTLNVTTLNVTTKYSLPKFYTADSEILISKLIRGL